jgi:hypothetical protein
VKHTMTRYETTQPWVTYTYGLTHDRWWPLWNSTRVLGRCRIACTCMVCGDRTVLSLRIPRFGEIPEPANGRHPAREKYLADHRHPDRGHPMSWALPMLNPAAHPGGLNIDLLAARLEADLNEETE